MLTHRLLKLDVNVQNLVNLNPVHTYLSISPDPYSRPYLYLKSLSRPCIRPALFYGNLNVGVPMCPYTVNLDLNDHLFCTVGRGMRSSLYYGHEYADINRNKLGTGTGMQNAPCRMRHASLIVHTKVLSNQVVLQST